MENGLESIQNNPSIEIYVLVARHHDGEEDIILAAGTLLLEQKFIHGGALVGHIEDVVVAKKARGLGLGKEIVDHLVKELAN